jgi:hypothetical protein
MGGCVGQSILVESHWIQYGFQSAVQSAANHYTDWAIVVGLFVTGPIQSPSTGWGTAKSGRITHTNALHTYIETAHRGRIGSTLLLHTGQVPGSNFGPETSHPNKFLCLTLFILVRHTCQYYRMIWLHRPLSLKRHRHTGRCNEIILQ